MKMTFAKRALLAVTLASGSVVAPLAAQAPIEIAAGAKVIDSAGGEVGTVTAIQGDNVVIKTDKHEVAVPKTSFAPSPNGLLFGMTRDQLNAEAEKSSGKGPDLAVGATVYDPQGGVVGTIEKVEADGATVKLPNSSVKIPAASFAAGPKGATVGETAASLEAKVAAANGSSGK